MYCYSFKCFSCFSSFFFLLFFASSLLANDVASSAVTPGDDVSTVDDDRVTTIHFEPGKGLDIKNGDGSFRLTTKLFGQVLYTMLYAAEAEDATQSLQIRRARLMFSGNWFGEHNKFKVQLAFSPKDMQFKNGNPTKSPVFDWILIFDHLRDLSIRLGQYRVPYSRQRRIPIAKLQLIDRAIANHEFNLDRDIGFDLHSKNLFGIDLLRYHAGVFIGEGRDAYAQTDLALLYSARIEILPLGIFKDYLGPDLERSRKPRLSIGAAYAFVDKAKGNKGIIGDAPTDGGTTDTHNLTADVMFKIAGVSLLGEVFYRQGRRDFGEATTIDDSGAEVPAPLEAPRDGMGWLAQLGWVVPVIPLELSARYSQVHPTGDETSLTRSDELGGGINWWIFGPSMKLAADYFHIFSDADIGAAVDQVRVQIQAGF